eukprot:366198-Chlamydomonas_euryale.AAC.4
MRAAWVLPVAHLHARQCKRAAVARAQRHDRCVAIVLGLWRRRCCGGGGGAARCRGGNRKTNAECEKTLGLG